jgi:type IVB pilus formation R64 PilN family outer membrane protein
MIKHAKLSVAILLALGLNGCETYRVTKAMNQADADADRASAVAESMRTQVGGNATDIKFTDQQWVSTVPVATKRGLPSALDCKVVYNERQTIQEFVSWLGTQCSKPIPVDLSPDALDYGASYMNQSGGNQRNSPPVAIPPPVAGESISDLFPTQGGGSNYGSASRSPYAGSRMVSQSYQGNLSGLLDSVTGALGLSWKYDAKNRAIRIFYLETRTFSVKSFNKSTTFTSSVKSGMSTAAGVSGGSSSGSGLNGGGTGGVSGDSGSQQATEMKLTSDVLEGIEQNVKSMLTLNRMAYSKATGIMTVTDRPEVLDRIQDYLDAENQVITKQILFNMEVLSVTLTDKDQYGIDWNLVYKSSKWGGGLANTFPGIDTSAVGGSASILDNSPWAGSKLLVKALSQQGKVSARTVPSVTTLNLQAAPVQIGRVQGYLASSQTTNSANVGSSTALTPGSITSGFNMSLYPFVPASGSEILLQVSINMIGDPKFDTITSGEASIQNPNYGTQTFSPSVKLRNGQTLVLSGFDQSVESTDKSGSGDASNFLFGGGGTRDKNHQVIVLLITPVILD